MNWIDRLPFRQRVVLVVAIGAALFVLGRWITFRGRRVSGWFGYAPNTKVSYYPGGMRPGLALLVHLAFIVLWAVVAFRLLRSASSRPSAESQPDPDKPPDE